MAQQALPAGNANRLFAVGKYQLIPSTMRSAVATLALNTQSALTHSVQEAFFRKYLVAVKRPQMKAFITGTGGSMGSAQMSLALEFASVARPDTGRSNYEGVGGNEASISAAETANRPNTGSTAYPARNASAAADNLLVGPKPPSPIATPASAPSATRTKCLMGDVLRTSYLRFAGTSAAGRRCMHQSLQAKAGPKRYRGC
jgi:hypothetical protein